MIPSAWRKAVGVHGADVVAVTLITSVAVVYCRAYLRFGLSYSPDSGFYALYAARLYKNFEYSAGAAMYAPLFPALNALAMAVTPFPGRAAVLVLSASIAIAQFSCYAASRRCGAPPPLALVFSTLIVVLPSSVHVFGFAWTEGVLLADLLLICATWAEWQETSRRRYFVAFVLANAAAPLIKYVAIYAPVTASAFIIVDQIAHRRPKRARHLPTAILIMFAPIVFHGLSNYRRWGVVTGHGASSVPVRDNLNALLTTIQSNLQNAGMVLVALGLLAALLSGRAGRLRGQLLCKPIVASLAYGIGFFAALVIGASTAQVDPIEARLCSPGFGPLVLAAAQGFGMLISSASKLPVRWTITGLAVAAAAYVSASPTLAAANEVRNMLSVWIEHPITAYSSGYGASSTRYSLSSFFEKELRLPHCTSVTYLHAEPPLGRVRREWFAIASALAFPPTRGIPAWIEAVDREHIWIRADELPGELVFLAARVPELHRIREPNREARHSAVQQRVAELMQRIVSVARQNGCSSHWILVPHSAGWFGVRPGEMFEQAAVIEERNLVTYRALRLETADR